MTILIIILIIILYCIGCILSLGRFAGDIYEIEEKYIDTLPCNYKSLLDLIQKESLFNIIHLASWGTFLAGTILYYARKQKYFFKWSFKPLHQLYQKYNSNETV